MFVPMEHQKCPASGGGIEKDKVAQMKVEVSGEDTPQRSSRK
jgi:hypothetical protein